MKKKIFITTIAGLSIAMGSVFADTTVIDTSINAGSHTILDTLNMPHFNALSKDDNYSWLISVLLIGRTVEVQSGVSMLYQNENLSGGVGVTQAASDIRVNIADTQGNIVKTLELGSAKTAGMVDFSWDGKSADGKQNLPSAYKISASATINGKTTPLATAGDFKVKSVAMGANGPVLKLDGLGSTEIASVIKIL